MNTTSPVRRLSEDTRADLLVALVVVFALALGWVYKSSLATRTTRAADPNSQFSLAIPSHWLTHESDSEDTFLVAENPNADSVYKSAVTGQSFLLDPQSPTALDTLTDGLILRHGEELTGYHLLDIQSRMIGGAEARVVEYAYVVQPIDQPFRASMPVVVRAFEYLIYTPTEYWLLTFTADERLVEKEREGFERMIGSIQLP